MVGLNLLIVAALLYFAARSANDLVAMWQPIPVSSTAAATSRAPSTPQDPARAAYEPIVERDVFNPVKENEPEDPKPVVATDLHLKLIGTSHLTQAQPFAIIEDQNNSRQDVYKLGNEIPDAGKLVAVQKTRVLIDHAGQIVALEIPKDMSAAPADKGAAAKLAARDRLEPPPPRPPRQRKSREERAAERIARRKARAADPELQARRAALRSEAAARRAAAGLPSAPAGEAPPPREADLPSD